MNNYSIVFNELANLDLEEIYNYISIKLSSGNAAAKLMRDIENDIMNLERFPFSGSNPENEILKAKGYKKLIVNNYIVFYLINETEQQITIMRVFYGMRNYANFL